MKEFFWLKVLDLFKGLFKRSEINYDVMRKIVQIKLTMDTRRVTMQSMQNTKNPTNKQKNYFLMSLIGYGFIGLISAMIMAMNFPLMYRYSVCLGITVVMLAMSLISDFSAVLLDVREKRLLLSKPINDKTLSAARFFHILTYLSTITAVFTGPMLVVSFLKDGAFVGLGLLVLIILSDLSIILFTGLFYYVFLKFFSGEKLKDIINYVQIGMSIVIFVGYQFIPRAVNIVDTSVIFTLKWWQIIVPSIVASAPLNIIAGGEINAISITFTILTLITPFIAIYIYSKVLIPKFENSLQKLDRVDETKIKLDKQGRQKESFSIKLSKILCRDNQERAVFKLTANMIKSDRRFKQTMYPNMAMSFIFPFIFMFNKVNMIGFNDFISDFYSFNGHLYGYFAFIMMCPQIVGLAYSEKAKGAWLYDILPFKNRMVIRKGAFKCFVVKFYYTVFTFHAAVFITLGGIRVIPDLIAMFMVMNIVGLICYNAFLKFNPFSMPYGTTSAKNTGLILMLSMGTGMVWAAHAFSKSFTYGNAIFNMLSCVVLIVFWIITFRQRPEKVEEKEEIKVNEV